MDTRPPDPTGPIVVQRDLVYGEGAIGYGTPQAGVRPLRLDVFLPRGEPPPRGRPALVLSHGGAYHRGAKDRDEFEQDGSRNTPVHEYCERFAARGYACFSVGYRLTQERPAPQPRPIKGDRQELHRSRTDYVRTLLGLPPATPEELLNGMEAVWADVAAAFAFVRTNAARWGIDTDRMAIGGFSAGAVASVYAAYALGQPAAAVVCLSGGMSPEDVEHYLHGGRGMPPLLMFHGEHDLPTIHLRSGALAEGAARVGLALRHYRVPGKPHFYDRESAVVPERATMPGGEDCTTVEAAMERFLDESLAPPAVDVDMLDAFAQAWNRHDIDALMSFMTDDCLFHAWTGPDACGTPYLGREAVRAGFMKAWADYPDAQWTRARHTVSGARGVSEWTFVGTRASDGERVEVDGCDLFTFRGDRIRVKDSWRKLRR